jgi:hypothetical protein
MSFSVVFAEVSGGSGGGILADLQAYAKRS